MPLLPVFAVSFLRRAVPKKRAPPELYKEGRKRWPERVIGQSVYLVVVPPTIRPLGEVVKDWVRRDVRPRLDGFVLSV